MNNILARYLFKKKKGLENKGGEKVRDRVWLGRGESVMVIHRAQKNKNYNLTLKTPEAR